ncbi:hypothetical protein BT96DRAFT_999685 [Gymnopus androsaceus JB14]|uniref:Uncharacterized protein n=1 Tax=Gymnopus androsaceus JB14 TaxID=1447944 RepID=A0A6A4H5T2_9AGAR|nr:hypothetical protein BT96DRAFT_999685 [Gymnopus androsaceus JB14]
MFCDPRNPPPRRRRVRPEPSSSSSGAAKTRTHNRTPEERKIWLQSQPLIKHTSVKPKSVHCLDAWLRHAPRCPGITGRKARARAEYDDDVSAAPATVDGGSMSEKVLGENDVDFEDEDEDMNGNEQMENPAMARILDGKSVSTLRDEADFRPPFLETQTYHQSMVREDPPVPLQTPIPCPQIRLYGYEDFVDAEGPGYRACTIPISNARESP